MLLTRLAPGDSTVSTNFIATLVVSSLKRHQKLKMKLFFSNEPPVVWARIVRTPQAPGNFSFQFPVILQILSNQSFKLNLIVYCREICLRPSSFEPTSVQEHTRYERLHKPKRINKVNLKKKGFALLYFHSILLFHAKKLLTSTSIYIYIYRGSLCFHFSVVHCSTRRSRAR